MISPKVTAALFTVLLSVSCLAQHPAGAAYRSDASETLEQEAVKTEQLVPGTSMTPEELWRRDLRRELHASLPESFDFMIDPYGKLGKGQIYSEPLVVSNHGIEPLKITIRNLTADTRASGYKQYSKILKQEMTIGESEEMPIGYSRELTIGYSVQKSLNRGNGSKITFRKDPIDPLVPSDQKEIQLLLHRVDRELPDIALTPDPAKPIVLILKENEDAVFELTGSVGISQNDPWEQGDVTVNATFDVESISAEEAERLLEQQKRGEEIAAEQEANKIIRYAASPEGDL